MNNDVRDDDRLLGLASSIDENRPIEWDTAEECAQDEHERAVVAELRVLAKLARVCQDPDGPGAMTEPDRVSCPSQTPATWGRLTILEPVGRGAFGTVFRARDDLNREVALKLFPVRREGSNELARRVLREGRLLAKVKHQNVVVVHGVDRSGDHVGLLMEFIRGRTMEDELRARGALSADEAALIGVDLCRALAAVHGRGLLHRDVKAQNVMREEGGRIVLMDFGGGSEETVGLAGVPNAAGTPLYLAPELFEGRPASRASDIYSLGVLLYRMITASYPVDGADRLEIGRAHREQKRQRLRDVRPDLPNGFVQVVERALASDPRQRYQTAAEFEHALAGSSGRITGQEPPVTHRLTRLRVAAAIAGVALIAAVPIWWFRSSRHDGSGAPVSGSTQSPRTPVESSQAASASTAPYSVKATFYRQRDHQEVQLAPGDRVAPGDKLALRIEASTNVYVYVVNADERGESFLLFPLPGREPSNPLTPTHVHRLPGSEDGREVHWQVTSVGGREHFLIFVSPALMTAFESMLRALPSPAPRRQVSENRIPDAVIGRLRGVGGLVTADITKKSGDAARWFDTADQLRGEAETARGLWVRQLTLENPAR